MELIQELFADDCLFRPTPENYLMIAAFCIIFCLSVIGNSIVVVVIVQQRSMRSVTNLYLLNLALSDLLLSVVCMPPTLVSSLLYCWVFGDLLCKLLAYLQPVVVTASAYTLAAIALERYYAICKPLHSRVWHTRSHALIVIGFVWLISIIANLFMLFMYELRTYNRNGLNCSPKYEPIVHFAYQIYMTMVLLIIPLVIMTVLYASVISSLKSGIKMDIAAIEISSYDNAKLFCSNNDNCSIFSKRKSFKLAKNNSIKNNNCQKLYKPRCNKYSLNNNNNNINKKWMKFNNKKPLSINNENKSNTINLISKNRFKCSFISMILFRSSQNHNKVLAHDIGNNYKEFESIDKIKKSTALLSEKSFSEKNNILESNERHNNHNAILSMARSVRSTHSGRTAQVKQRLIRMLIVIVIIFFCCWTPSYIWWLLLNAQDSFGIFNVWNSELNTFITVLTYLSSCTNPITYCFLNSKFRNALFLSFGCNCFSRRTLRSHFQRVYAPYISKNLLNEDKNQLLSNKRKSASICLINTSNFSNNNDVSDNTCQSDATSVTYDKSNNNQVTLLSSENLLQQEKQIKYKVNNKNNILDKKLIKITIDKLFDNYYDANNVSYASNVLNFFTKPLIVSNMLNLLQNAFIFFNASETIRWKQNLKTKNNLKVNAVVMKNPLINCYNYKINTGCEHCCSSKLKLKSFDKNVIDNTLTLFINKINYNFSKNINSDFNDNLIYNNANIFNQFTPDLINNNSNELAATKINNNIISVMPMILKKNSSSTSISPILSSFTVNNLKKTSKQKHLPNCFTLKSIHQSQSDPLISSKEFDLEIVNHANCESSI